MKKRTICTIGELLRYAVCTAGVVTACYGFWGSLFPDLTFVEGTYRVVGEERYEGTGEELFCDILEDKVSVTYGSRLWEIIRNKCGYKK